MRVIALILLLTGVSMAQPLSEYSTIIGGKGESKIVSVGIAPLNYYDGKGKLSAIDTKFTDDSVSGYNAKAETQKYSIKVDDNGGRRVYFSDTSWFDLGRMQYKNSSNDWANLPIDSVARNDNVITVKHSLYSITIKNLPNKMKLEIIISSDTVLRPLRCSWSVQGCKLSGSSNTASWLIESDDGSGGVSLERPFVSRDKKGRVNRPVDFFRTASYIYMTPDVKGLEVPVYIDPSVVYSTQPTGNYDTTLSSAYPTDVYFSDMILYTGRAGADGEILRTLVKFDLSSIPAGKICLGATMYLTMTFGDNPTVERAHSVYQLRSGRNDWVASEATWLRYKTGSAWGTDGCSNTTSDYNPTAIGTFTSPSSYPQISTIAITASVVQGWFGGSSYGIMLKCDTENVDYRKREWASSKDDTPEYLPRMEIEYTDPSVVQSAVPRVLIFGE